MDSIANANVRRSNRIGSGLFGERADGEAGAGGPEQERAFRFRLALPCSMPCLLVTPPPPWMAFRFPAGLVD
jgi:hypothetical protein